MVFSATHPILNNRQITWIDLRYVSPTSQGLLPIAQMSKWARFFCAVSPRLPISRISRCLKPAGLQLRPGLQMRKDGSRTGNPSRRLRTASYSGFENPPPDWVLVPVTHGVLDIPATCLEASRIDMSGLEIFESWRSTHLLLPWRYKAMSNCKPLTKPVILTKPSLPIIETHSRCLVHRIYRNS